MPPASASPLRTAWVWAAAGTATRVAAGRTPVRTVFSMWGSMPGWRVAVRYDGLGQGRPHTGGSDIAAQERSGRLVDEDPRLTILRHRGQAQSGLHSLDQHRVAGHGGAVLGPQQHRHLEGRPAGG